MAETKKAETKKTEAKTEAKAETKAETKTQAKAEAKAEPKTESKPAVRATIRIQYFRSKIQAPVKHKRVIQGLGFTRLNQIVVREDTPSIRGMVKTVPHLVRILN
jgi:large subunit ribosomal protein L30